jgi:sugar lactone lactonase YvrE
LWLPASEQNTLHGYDDVQLRGTINEPGSITLTGVGVQPFGTAFDAEGNLWVSSFGSDALLFYAADQIDASGDPIPAATIADDGSGTLDGPVGIAFDTQGDLWVGNYLGNTLVQYTAQQLATATTAGGESFATPQVIINSGVLNRPYGHAFDAEGNLWVGNNRGDNLLGFLPGQINNSGSPPPAAIIDQTTTGTLDAARGPAFDADGDLWLSSRRTGQLVQYSIDENGDPIPITTTNIRLEDGTTPAAPAGIAFDAEGNLWVTDSISDQLLRYDITGLTDGGTAVAARTIEGFGTFGPIGGVLLSFFPPPEGLPIAQ